VKERLAPGYSAFRPRPPWWGPDLQTLRNFLRGPTHPDGSADPAARAVQTTRVELPMRDGSGDRLVALLQQSASEHASVRPLAVLIHGLGGTGESAYIQSTAATLLARGHTVVRLNLRGAGPSRPLCRLQYHAGRTDDLHDALVALDAEETTGSREAGLVIVGYSLGGNMLLKFLAEHASAFDVRAAVSVSAPIDLAAASQRFLHPRNRVYHWNLLRSMRGEALAAPVDLPPEEVRAIRAARSILAFDENFVAPRNGYVGADEYYRANAARYFLGRIRVPTLLICSLDDPWIPATAYTEHPWSDNANLIPLLSRGGGHVGFHAAGTRTPWHDECIVRHLESLSC
jgi:predicted alpha/beta-fold hydrolase